MPFLHRSGTDDNNKNKIIKKKMFSPSSTKSSMTILVTISRHTREGAIWYCGLLEERAPTILITVHEKWHTKGELWLHDFVYSSILNSRIDIIYYILIQIQSKTIIV